MLTNGRRGDTAELVDLEPMRVEKLQGLLFAQPLCRFSTRLVHGGQNRPVGVSGRSQ